MSEENNLSFWQRLTIVTLSATVGAAAVIWYLLDQKRQEVRGKPAPRPTRAIRLKHPAGVSAQPPASEVAQKADEALSMRVSARPGTFKRGADGTIRVKAAPGAVCTIDATYSTNRTPTGLEDEPLECGADGICEWTWRIGTSGDYVDVEVVATKGDETVAREKRVKIMD